MVIDPWVGEVLCPLRTPSAHYCDTDLLVSYVLYFYRFSSASVVSGSFA